MSSHPKTVRDARVKCVSCNAPVSVTVDDRYVCVECGRSVLSQRNQPVGDGGAIVAQQAGGKTTVGPATPATSLEGGPESDIERAEIEAEPSILVDPESAEQPDLSFVLPTRNEEGGIEECIDRAIRAAERLDMPAEIIVSDSSTDMTPVIAERKGARVVAPLEEGYGAAYRHGFEHARGDFIVMGDADTTYDFEELPALIEPLLAGEADIVMGSRLEGEIEPGAMPALHRYVGNPLLTKFLNVFYGTDVSDAHSGFRVLTRDALERLDIHSSGMEFASEMVMDAGEKNLHIEEVPITYSKRIGDATLHSFSDGWRHVKFMLTNCPTYLFAVPGMVLGLLGVLMMSLSAYGGSLGAITWGVHTMIVGSLLTILGFHVGSLALFASVGADPIRKPRDPLTRWAETHFRLERAMLAGFTLFGAGGLYVGYLVVQWAVLGQAVQPLVTPHLIAFTAMVIGIAVVFNAFHLDAIAQRRS